MKQVKDGGVPIIAGAVSLIVFAGVVIGVFSYQPKRALQGARAVGPRVPIPTVDAATLETGRHVFQTQNCTGCHTMTGVPIGAVPDLLHEGQRNADIDWQIFNLRAHHSIHPNSDMPNYDKLPPDQLRALASYLATRK